MWRLSLPTNRAKFVHQRMVSSIIVTKSAKDKIILEIRKNLHVETGGVLVGFYNNDNIIIDSVSGPGPNANHSLTEFVIDEAYMYDFLDIEYVNSNGKNIYVGEWHTHPQVEPFPSEQDFQSFYERSIEWKHGELVFIIIGFIGLTDDNIEGQIIGINFKNNFKQIPIIFE